MINLLLNTLLAASLRDGIDLDQGLIHSKSPQRYDVEIDEIPQEEFIQPFGKLRAGYLFRDEHLTELLEKDANYATVIGGYFGFNTSVYKGFYLHLAAYVSSTIEELSDSDFTQADIYSYVYLGEASLEYKDENFEVKLGRIRIDTPYADSDDIRISPNTFEGGWSNFLLSDSLFAEVYYLSSMAGTDSVGKQNEFDPLYDKDAFGLVGASLDYYYKEDSHVALWYYYVDKMSQIIYAEATYEKDMGQDFHLAIALQGSSILDIDNSNISGDVLGIGSILHYKRFFMGGAYNYAFVNKGQIISDGFGGGPYYTSLDEATIGAVSSLAVGKDIQAYRLGIGYEKLFNEDLTLEYIHGHLNSKDKYVSINEDDVVLTYHINKPLYFELIGAIYDAKGFQDDFERLIIRLDYSF